MCPKDVLVFYGSVRGRETQGTDNTPATITKWNLQTSVLRFLLLAGLALYLQTPPCLYVFSVLQRLGLFSILLFVSSSLFHLSSLLSWFSVYSLNSQYRLPYSWHAPSPALTPSTSAPTHSLTPRVDFFFFFPFKYLDRSHCGFFSPVHSRTVSMPLLFPFLFMKSLKRGENKFGIRYGAEMNSIAFSMFCLCPPHLQITVTVWKQPTGSGNFQLFLSKLFKFWVHTTFFSFYIFFFFLSSTTPRFESWSIPKLQVLSSGVRPRYITITYWAC